MKKILKMGIVLTFMLFILTGCTNTEYNVKVKNNGKGKVEYSIEYDEKAVEEYLNAGNEIFKNVNIEELYNLSDESDLFADLIKKAENSGYTTERIKDGERTKGYTASKDFDNMSEFKIKESLSEDYVTITDDTGMKIEKGFFVTKYTQTVDINLQKGGEAINKVKLAYNFPIGISKSNADNKSLFTNKLTWELTRGENQKIEYTVYAFNISLIIAIVLIIILIILVIILLIKKSKKNKK